MECHRNNVGNADLTNAKPLTDLIVLTSVTTHEASQMFVSCWISNAHPLWEIWRAGRPGNPASLPVNRKVGSRDLDFFRPKMWLAYRVGDDQKPLCACRPTWLAGRSQWPPPWVSRLPGRWGRGRRGEWDASAGLMRFSVCGPFGSVHLAALMSFQCSASLSAPSVIGRFTSNCCLGPTSMCHVCGGKCKRGIRVVEWL